MVLLAAAQMTPVPAAEPPVDDIVVIGRKLRNWRATLKSNKRGTTCVTRRSSGDPEIDAIGCAAMVECWPDAKARFDASQAKGLARSERKRLMTEADQAFGECTFPKREALIEALAAKRAAARAGGGA